MELLAALSIGAAAFLLAHVILRRQPSVTRVRLDEIGRSGLHDAAPAAPDLSQRVIRPLMRGIRNGAAALLPDHLGEWVEREIATAGMRFSAGTFITTTIATTFGFVGFVMLMVLAGEQGMTSTSWLLMAAAGGLGLLGPSVWLRGRATRRQAVIQRDLPDTLDLIVVSVEAGLGFEAAIARITDQSTGPLSEELRRVLADMNLGMSRRDAMQAMAVRAHVAGVTSLITAILQAERTGMGIGNVLRSQSAHIRMQRRQRAEEAAMKAPLKMLFPLIFFIFPSLFVVVLGPAVLNLMRAMGG